MPNLCHTLILAVNPAKIAYLRFVLEGYDGMAYLTTLDSQRGLVQLCYLPSFTRDLFSLLAEIAPGIRAIKT